MTQILIVIISYSFYAFNEAICSSKSINLDFIFKWKLKVPERRS